MTAPSPVRPGSTTGRIAELEALGQSVWFDNIRRGLLTSGEFERMVREDGLSGVTSNPSIFEKAIVGSTDYDEALAEARAAAARMAEAPDPKSVYEGLAIADLRQAADMLRPVYEETDAGDGYVSMEVVARPGARHRRHGRGGAAAVGGGRPAEPDDQGAGDRGRHPGDPAADRRRDQRQHHAAVLDHGLRTRGRGLPGRVGGPAGRRRRHRAGRVGGELLHQPDRLRGRPAGERARCRARSGSPTRSSPMLRFRELFERRALAGSAGSRRPGPAAAVGIDQHQEPGVFRRALRRVADRAGHRRHDLPRDLRGVQGPRQGARRR